MNADAQPVGEYPPINRFDLVPMDCVCGPWLPRK